MINLLHIYKYFDHVGDRQKCYYFLKSFALQTSVISFRSKQDSNPHLLWFETQVSLPFRPFNLLLHDKWKQNKYSRYLIFDSYCCSKLLSTTAFQNSWNWFKKNDWLEKFENRKISNLLSRSLPRLLVPDSTSSSSESNTAEGWLHTVNPDGKGKIGVWILAFPCNIYFPWLC